MTVTRKWSFLALLLVVAIFAAGWFLLISPKRGEAADLRSQTASQEEANSRLEQKIQVLMAQQEDLPRKRAQLAVIRTRIPDNPALPTLVRELTAASQKVGASIVTLAPALPVAAAPAAQAPVASTDGTTGTAPAPAAASLYQVPLTVEVAGSYFELEQFVNKLEGLKRAFLVTGFTLGAAEGEEAVPGELKLSLQGRVFLSPEAATTAAAPATGTTTTSTTPTGTTTTSDATAPAAQ
jgi:type IV pilus assembly protein PilO